MTPNGKPSRKLKIPCANNTCGFDPHHRHKKEAPQLVWGAFFLSAACERVEQHDPAQQGEQSALRAVAQCAGDPHHRHKKELADFGYTGLFGKGQTKVTTEIIEL